MAGRGQDEPLAGWSVKDWEEGSQDLGDTFPPNSFLYRKIIGQGGFGEVWEAVQVSLGRVVALKCIRQDLVEMGEREPDKGRYLELTFRQEALTAAQLEHPNIVPIHDLGIDEKGSPLLAMKLVRGEPWHRIIARDFKELAVPDFLAKHLPILMSVTQAVAFTHSRGIVHRDLKPSQVMVGEFGEVYLMDWGLAVLYDRALLEKSESAIFSDVAPTVAMASSPAGTAAFMAPEQTRESARDVGPWTDIYLLGGTLHFLLCGHPPHHAENAKVSFLKAVHGEVVVPREVCPGRIIPKDLEELSRRAMAPEPANRVPGAKEFLDGLRDYISGSSKRRESRSITDRVSAMLSEASVEYEVYARCLTLLTQAEAHWGQNPDVGQLREKALIGLSHLALENGDLVLARMQAIRVAQDETREELLTSIDAESARLLREARHRRIALAASGVFLVLLGAIIVLLLFERGERTRAEDREAVQREVARTLTEVLQLRRDEAALAAELSRALPLPDELEAEEEAPRAVANQSVAAQLLNRRAELRLQRERLAASGVEGLDPEPYELLLADANFAFHSARRRDDFLAVADQFRAIADATSRVEAVQGAGVALYRAENYTSASIVLRAGIDESARVRGERSVEHGRYLSLVGLALSAAEDHLPGYSKYLEESLDILGRQYLEIADGISNQFVRLGRYADATQLTSPSLFIAREVLAPEDPLLSAVLSRAGHNYVMTGELRQAEAVLLEALSNYQQLGEGFLDRLGSVENALASIYLETARFDLAEQYSVASIDHWTRSFDSEHRLLAFALNNHGLLLMNTGRQDEAAPYFEQSHDMFVRLYGPEHPDVALPLDNLGALHLIQMRMDLGLEFLNRALEIKLATLGPRHPRVATGLINIAAAELHSGRIADSERHMREAIDIYENESGGKSGRLGILYNNLSSVLLRQGRVEESLAADRRALEIYEAAYGRIHPEYAGGLRRMAETLKDGGRFEEARPLVLEAIDIQKQLIAQQPEARSFIGQFNVHQIILAEIELELGNTAAAEYAARLAISEFLDPPAVEQRERPRRLAAAGRHLLLGRILDAKGSPEEAAPEYERALAILATIDDQGHLELLVKAEALLRLGRIGEGRETLSRIDRSRAHAPDLKRIEELARKAGETP
jgi:serine/threonine protein kinase/tetratricopeptide (TPR) repeat protein